MCNLCHLCLLYLFLSVYVCNKKDSNTSRKGRKIYIVHYHTYYFTWNNINNIHFVLFTFETTMALSTVLWGEGYSFLETWLSGHLGWGEPSESGESLADLVKGDIHY